MTVPAVIDIRPDVLVPVDSKHPLHADMFKTLDLLKIETVNGPLYFVVEGCSKFCPKAELESGHRFFYEEHTCPINFTRVEAICFGGNMDPHGVFEFVASEWMTTDYDADNQDEYLASIFPQLRVKP